MGKILITGGNGFIGSHLAEKLEENGDTITLLDIGFNSNTDSLGCEKIQGDVRDYETVRKVVHDKDAVFHFAAVSRVAWGQEDPFKCWQTNQFGTVNVLEAASKSNSRPILFYASSREVYGEPAYFPVRETHPKNPVSIYGLTKLCAEKACQSYLSSSNGPVKQVIFRFSNVYGSHRDLPQRVIPKFMGEATKGTDITLYGGDQILDFTFIDDTVSGILRAYNTAMDNPNGISGEDFHFVTGRGVSVSELAAMIIRTLDSPSKIVLGAANSFDVRKFVGDPSKSREKLGYEPRVKLEDGLKILSEKIQSLDMSSRTQNRPGTLLDEALIN